MSLFDTGAEADITEENAYWFDSASDPYTYLCCPRCEFHEDLFVVGRGEHRSVDCINCGFSGTVADGVQLRKRPD